MAAWPASLPPAFLIRGASLSPTEQSIQTTMTVGPPKIRRRTSLDVTMIPAQQLLTGTQVATLETFYVTTTSGGSATWTHVHPITGAAANFQFASRPSFTPSVGHGTAASRLWVTDYDLRIIG